MDRLADYRGKRDASRTPEPVPPADGVAQPAGPGPAAEPAGGPEATREAGAGIFVVQEHHARRLHWDFRLERDGVLVSWALPKGVPDDPGVNHLAVHTEDHPMEYATFHGQIPRGEYGGGAVTIWDHGTYELVKWDDREVKVVLHGERLSGGYALFCTDRSKNKDWIIHRERLGLPAALPPMLAAIGAFPRYDADAWAVEMKWDGVRALAFIEAGRLTLRSRTGKDITATYPELAGLGNAIGRRQALLDGEIVAFNDAAQPDFEALQPRIHVTSAAQARQLAAITPVTYLAFDLLQLDGRPLAGRPYRDRRDLLTPLIPNGSWFLCPPAFPGADFDAVLAASAANGLEGVVAKRLDSRYEPGVRSGDWLKVKNVLRQEVVVAGWKPGKGNRTGQVGSLLVGVYSDQGPMPGEVGGGKEGPMPGEVGGGKEGPMPGEVGGGKEGPMPGEVGGGKSSLLYCGHVGTGFTVETLRMLGDLLAPLSRAGSPFDGPVPAPDARSAVWVEPRLVIDVTFGRWTRAGRMRAPVYKGLRDDKDPAEVVRET